MEIKKYLLSFFSILFLLSVTVIAQEEMTKDEWEAEMTRLKDKKESLTKEISALQNEVNNLKATKVQSYDDCMNELYSMVGATKADVDNFRKAVNELDGKIRRKEGPKVDRQKDLDALKMNKISALPEFFDKVQNQMQRSLDSWVEEVKETNYTVVKGDHLWGIAKKPEHYGNGFAWPMIYKANRDKIKNPDLIYPKQVFSIPKLTEEEKAKYDKIRKNYKPAPVQ
jgi:uncharacterized protein YdcH (DUF465 family)